jgi:hypothetical protein
MENSRWPHNTDVTYVDEFVDTHNAFNPTNGIFTAPFDGMYRFIFYAYCDSDNGDLYAYHNDVILHVFSRYSVGVTGGASSAYFALHLEQNDRVKINSGNSGIFLKYFPAKFMGFLLQ